jgi:hypothetical protein
LFWEPTGEDPHRVLVARPPMKKQQNRMWAIPAWLAQPDNPVIDLKDFRTVIHWYPR